MLLRVPSRYCVYVIHWSDKGPTKVGVAKNPTLRRSNLQVGSPYELKIYGAISLSLSDKAYETEKDVLRKFKEFRLCGEWLDLPPDVVMTGLEQIVIRYKYRWERWVNKSNAPTNRRGRALSEYYASIGAPSNQ